MVAVDVVVLVVVVLLLAVATLLLGDSPGGIGLCMGRRKNGWNL